MATSYPKENAIQFTPSSGTNSNVIEEHTLRVSNVVTAIGPSLMFTMVAPMKILTAKETREFARWIVAQCEDLNKEGEEEHD